MGRGERALNYVFPRVPNEIRLLIAEYLGPRDLNSLLRTCQELHLLLTPLLHNLATYDLKGGYPALCWAAEHGHEPLVRLLLEKGADIEIRYKPCVSTSYCSTPLQYAVCFGHEAIVELLLLKGAKIETTKLDPFSPFFIAARAGHDKVMKLLLEQRAGVDLLLSDPYGPMVLEELVKKGNEAAIRMLLEKGVNVNWRNPFNYDRMPLHAAVKSAGKATGTSCKTVIQLLLEKGADIEALDNEYQSPLILAVETGREDIVRLLVESGAKLNAPQNGAEPILQHVLSSYRRWISLSRSQAMIDTLLELGADINFTNHLGGTALVHAIKTKKTELACFLLDRGADVFLKTKRSNFPGRDVFVRPRNRNQTTILSWINVTNCDSRIVDMILDRLTHIEAECWQDTDEAVVLLWAVWAGHEGMVRLLLDRGIDIINRDFEVQNSDYNTPIIQHGRTKIGDRENLGSMALHLANELGHKSVAKILSNRGVRVEHRVEQKLDWPDFIFV